MINNILNSKNRRKRLHPLTPYKILGKVLCGCSDRRTQSKISGFLDRWSEQVDFSSDGRECIEASLTAIKKSDPYNLILLDTQLSVLDAYSVTQFLRENKYPATIISFSKEYLPIYECQSEEAGCNGHLLRDNIESGLPNILSYNTLRYCA